MTKVVATLRSGLNLLGVIGTPPKYLELDKNPFSTDRKALRSDRRELSGDVYRAAKRVLNDAKKVRGSTY